MMSSEGGFSSEGIQAVPQVDNAQKAETVPDEARIRLLPAIIQVEPPRQGVTASQLLFPQAGDTVILDQVTARDQQASSEFDASNHLQQLYGRAVELMKSSEIGEYLKKVPLQDIRNLRNILTREQNTPTYSTIASVLITEIGRRVSPSEVIHKQATPDDNYEKNLREGFRAFSRDFYGHIDVESPPEAILGVTELDRTAIIKRSAELSTALSMGYIVTTETRFVNSLINRASQTLLRRIDEEERQKSQIQSAEVQTVTDSQVVEETPDNIPEQPQRWLSVLREMRYRNLTGILQNLQEREGAEGMQRWFLNLVNTRILAEGREPLGEDAVRSLSLLTVEAASASQIAGQEIKRPVFTFRNPKDHNDFLERFVGHRIDGASLHIPLMVEEVSGDLSQKTGIIIAQPDGIAIGHEIIHSIDPHFEEREGADRIINELFAYTAEKIYHTDLTDVSHDELRTELVDSLSNDAYYQIYARRTNSSLTQEQFREICTASADVASLLRKQKGDVEALRSIVQARTLRDLFGYVDQEPPTFDTAITS